MITVVMITNLTPATFMFVMAVTTLRQMPHTEIDDSFKSELLWALGDSPNFYLSRSTRRLSVFASLKKRV